MSEFTIGQSESLTKAIDIRDIDRYAELSGDANPIHLDESYARRTRFGGRIAHGMLVAGLISAVLGTRLPGPGGVYLGQDLRFCAPVRPGDTVTARVQVTDWDSEKARLSLSTEVTNQNGVVVISGHARMLVDRRPGLDASDIT